MTISLCMIVKNEEEVLGRCLDSVQGIADEIIIVDTGSEDDTVRIAHRYTDKVYYFEWIDDFSAARNYAFSKAASDYIMWLDADDVILEKHRPAFMALKETLEPDVDVVMAKYDLAFNESGEATFSNYRERILRRAAGFEWVGPVHEVIVPRGKIIYAKEAAVSHMKAKKPDPKRNLLIMEKHLEKGGALDARQTFYYARELMDNGMDEKAAQVFHEFLQRSDGWVENRIEACRNLSLCLNRLGRMDEALTALFESFRYDAPRAEILCQIGRWFMDRGRLREAAYWYEGALMLKPQPERGGFVLLDCYGYTPAIQLCVVYDRMGRHEEAEKMNSLAEHFRPGDRAVALNKTYFESRRKA